MNLRRFRTISSITLASIVLAVVIIGRIPTSECTCSKPEQQQEENECPFGKLRLLAGFALASDLVLLSPPEPGYEKLLFSVVFFQELDTLLSYSPRAPPFFLI